MIYVGKAYLTKDAGLVVCGNPDDHGGLHGHNCDQMGCGSEHVLFRINLDSGHIDDGTRHRTAEVVSAARVPDSARVFGIEPPMEDK